MMPLIAGRSPNLSGALPGEARLGPGPHVSGCHGPHSARLVPGSGGEGMMPLPAGRSPARAGALRVWGATANMLLGWCRAAGGRA